MSSLSHIGQRKHLRTLQKLAGNVVTGPSKASIAQQKALESMSRRLREQADTATADCLDGALACWTIPSSFTPLITALRYYASGSIDTAAGRTAPPAGMAANAAKDS